MTTTALTLDSIPSCIETCHPNLMPFRVAYSGPAAISTFMIVKPAEATEVTAEAKETTGNGDPSSGTEDTTTTSASDAVPDEENAVDNDVVMPQIKVEGANEQARADGTSDKADRFVSSFRGRTIHGLTVQLPEGYGGLVLKSSGTQPASSTCTASVSSKPRAPKKHAAPKSKPRGRLTRSAASSKRVVDVDEVQVETIDDEDEDLDAMNIDEGSSAASQDPVGSKNLVPAALFSSFVVWRPDYPVAELQDEYIRSIQEWTALAAELHRPEIL